MKCRYCKSNCHKCGRQPSGIQKYRCQKCLKYQQASYKSKALHLATNKRIRNLVKEGVGIRGIARLLKISTTTVIKRIRAIASNLKRPEIHSYHAIYEIDEMWTFSKSKKNQQWITYIFERGTKRVMDFVVGRRSVDCLRPMISRALTFQPKFIATDGLMVYRSIIPSNLHVRDPYQTLRIERNNLNLRTHLKRLSRKTINYSKSVSMLSSVLTLYFWA